MKIYWQILFFFGVPLTTFAQMDYVETLKTLSSLRLNYSLNSEENFYQYFGQKDSILGNKIVEVTDTLFCGNDIDIQGKIYPKHCIKVGGYPASPYTPIYNGYWSRDESLINERNISSRSSYPFYNHQDYIYVKNNPNNYHSTGNIQTLGNLIERRWYNTHLDSLRYSSPYYGWNDDYTIRGDSTFLADSTYFDTIYNFPIVEEYIVTYKKQLNNVPIYINPDTILNMTISYQGTHVDDSFINNIGFFKHLQSLNIADLKHYNYNTDILAKTLNCLGELEEIFDNNPLNVDLYKELDEKIKINLDFFYNGTESNYEKLNKLFNTKSNINHLKLTIIGDANNSPLENYIHPFLEGIANMKNLSSLSIGFDYNTSNIKQYFPPDLYKSQVNYLYYNTLNENILPDRIEMMDCLKALYIRCNEHNLFGEIHFNKGFSNLNVLILENINYSENKNIINNSIEFSHGSMNNLEVLILSDLDSTTTIKGLKNLKNLKVAVIGLNLIYEDISNKDYQEIIKKIIKLKNIEYVGFFNTPSIEDYDFLLSKKNKAKLVPIELIGVSDEAMNISIKEQELQQWIHKISGIKLIKLNN